MVSFGAIRCAIATYGLARRSREVPKDRPVIEAAKATLTSATGRIFWCWKASQPVVERTGEYADIFALRGYDSMQVAAAFEAGQIAETIIDLACFDARLNKAAQVLGMRVLRTA